MTTKLCYIRENKAWFTTQELHEQWGDDWDDVPYEHNAEEPNQVDGHKLTTIMFEGEFELPHYGYTNSLYSVEMINAKHMAWLRTKSWLPKMESLFAGASEDEFIAFVEKHDGGIYLPKRLS